jgi:predicted nucleic acid-binding protein
MREQRCTIDTSCIIALDRLDLVPQLSFLFSVVLVPKAVRIELSRLRSSRHRLRGLLDAYGFFQRCDQYDQGTVDFLLAERKRLGTRDRGEVEAVVQAAQVGAVVIVDDPWGRELAARDDLEHHGTMWVLQRFHELQLLTSNSLHECFVALRATGSRLPWHDVNELLKATGEPPLPRR